jgi:hypothetical protein
VLRVVLALPAIGFLVTGLRFAVAPAGAAQGLALSLTAATIGPIEP